MNYYFIRMKYFISLLKMHLGVWRYTPNDVLYAPCQAFNAVLSLMKKKILLSKVLSIDFATLKLCHSALNIGRIFERHFKIRLFMCS